MSLGLASHQRCVVRLISVLCVFQSEIDWNLSMVVVRTQRSTLATGHLNAV